MSKEIGKLFRMKAGDVAAPEVAKLVEGLRQYAESEEFRATCESISPCGADARAAASAAIAQMCEQIDWEASRRATQQVIDSLIAGVLSNAGRPAFHDASALFRGKGYQRGH